MSSLDIIGHADLRDLFKSGRHTLVIGQPRSGKTTFLFYLTMLFHLAGEYIVVRDIGEAFEFLSLAEARVKGVAEDGFQLRGFVPEGCRINYNHKNFEQVTYDPTDLTTLFDQLTNEKINLVFFEIFTLDLKLQVKFWNKFFTQLLFWKRLPRHWKLPICLIMDEFADLCPGKGRSFLRDQHRVSQLIAYNHRKFRRHYIRLIGAVHYFRDITVPVRQRFDCYVIKKNYPNPDEVPFTLQNYIRLFPKLEVDELIYLDSAKNFNRFTLPMYIKPVPHNDIRYEGSVDDLFSESDRTKNMLDMWRDRAISTVDLAMSHGIRSAEIAERWGTDEVTVRTALSKWRRGGFEWQRTP